ncbi:MAG: hypothetical protein JSS66_08335 [Armatimonadetes bacterium]|nr:hypothetical protein [Armatimonadota bacterium]
MRAKSLLFVCLACAVVSANAQDTKTLRFNIAPGTTLASTSVTDSKFVISGPMDQEAKNKTTIVQEYKFDSGADGWLKFLLTTTDFKMEGDDLNFGMGGGATDMAAAVKSVKVNGEVNNLGKTRNVAAGGVDQLDMMTKQMLSSIIDRINQIGLLMMSYPEEAVGVGSKWKVDMNLGKALEAIPFFENCKGTAPVEFTLESFEKLDGKDVAKVKVFIDGKVTFDLQGGQGSGNMSTTSAGNVWIDLATGIPSKGETKMANAIDFGMGNLQQEMTITSTVSVKN